MTDSLSKQERSALMASVKGKGNRSTEIAVETILRAHKISGWKKHPKHIMGRPDFYFHRANLAVFVDGCFWHACPKCGRLPKSRREFWATKIENNRKRDNRIRRHLRSMGVSTIRIWEHELRTHSWLNRLLLRLHQ